MVKSVKVGDLSMVRVTVRVSVRVRVSKLLGYGKFTASLG